MGECVCTTNEEVRKCMANCDLTPRRKSKRMSNRLNKEREEKLQPLRFKHAVAVIKELGYEVKELGQISLQFKYKNETVTYYPYSGWASGKTIKDGRGLDNLLKQLK